MALKPSPGIEEKFHREDQPRPVLFRSELREHLREPVVAARMKRVHRQIAARAQQKD